MAMNRTLRFLSSSLLAVALVLSVRGARAADSTRAGMYVEGSPVGTGTFPLGCVQTQFGCLNNRAEGAYRLSAEFGVHFTGRHDGFVLGVRQVFLFGSLSGGISEARVGYDIAIPIKQFEVTIAPYGVAGVAYVFDPGGHAAAALGVGAEGKFFFKDNLYAFLIPFELGGWIGSGYSGVQYQGAVGIGYAF
jgi:hypothetical protein